MRILAECNQREMSPQSFHRLVGGGTLSKVDRAFELLVQYDWLERTRSEGEEEHFYRGTASPTMADEVFAALPDSTKALVTSRIFESLAARTREAMKAGTIAARPDTHFTWTPLELDQQGWDDLIARLDSIFLSLAEEQDRAQARMEDTGEEPIQMTLAMLGFESPKNPERKFS
ncbi:MAG TPA: hypothetical protein VK471_05410 [Solirubrobacterales bacterium]|nr:hypothetical protein [Solirubrobacterales bacterium]